MGQTFKLHSDFSRKHTHKTILKLYEPEHSECSMLVM